MAETQTASFLGTWSALLAVSLGIFAITLDGSMMPVAIGSIVDDLNTQVAFVQAAMALQLDMSSLVPALFVFGAGAGMVLARLTEITLSKVKSSELGEAAGGDSTGKELGVGVRGIRPRLDLSCADVRPRRG